MNIEQHNNNNVTQYIQQKYKPTKLTNIIGNNKSIAYIEEWLNTYNDVKEFLKRNGLLKKSSKGRKKKLVNMNPDEIEYSKRKGNLLITGPHGSGKSTITSIILKNNNYDIINLNSLDSKIKIDIDLIAKLSSKNMNDNTKKTILLIDELESVITLNDKTAVFNIIKDNNFNRWMPIIIITNNQHNKQLSETKKHSNEIKIYSPFLSEITKWVHTICKSERIPLQYDIIPKFIEYCQSDMRKILIQLDELKVNYCNNNNNAIITNVQLEEFMDIMKNKDQDFDLYKSTEKMLTNYKDIDNCLELYDSEKVLVPLMIHENYHKFIIESEYSRILDNLSRGDILENYIHGEQNWDLLEIHGLISCAIPSYYINKFSNHANNTPNTLIFAADLNRTSVKKMNKKNINKTNESILKNSYKNIRNKSIDEFIYMGEIVDHTNDPSNTNTKTKESTTCMNNIIKINKLKSTKKKI
ncbi:MAG: replication factor C large subunit [Gaeavirus sp.]|uniref:Replication factor C large subunit n=1 Tax=Gaeavirus sp. TaxID=2487767 RepID=A0A3G5A1I7_9VIRU|nr:MAG: replication factor C large subunit [Gaeavirus sp.]